MTPRERAERIQLISRTPSEIWDEIEQAITAAVEAEREACAKIVDSEAQQIEEWGAPSAEELTRVLAHRIRAGSNAASAPPKG